MKLKIIKTCQPNSTKYEKGKVYNVSGVDANHMLSRGLAERYPKADDVATTSSDSYTEKVSKSTKKKSTKSKSKTK